MPALNLAAQEIVTSSDFIGVALRARHSIIELSLPTYPYLTDFDNHNAWAFSFNLGAYWLP